MKAFVRNNSGLMLLVPKDGRCSMLFLEWMCQNQSIAVSKIIDSGAYTNHFAVRMNGIMEDFISASLYINSNL